VYVLQQQLGKRVLATSVEHCIVFLWNCSMC